MIWTKRACPAAEYPRLGDEIKAEQTFVEQKGKVNINANERTEQHTHACADSSSSSLELGASGGGPLWMLLLGPAPALMAVQAAALG